MNKFYPTILAAATIAIACASPVLASQGTRKPTPMCSGIPGAAICKTQAIKADAAFWPTDDNKAPERTVSGGTR